MDFQLDGVTEYLRSGALVVAVLITLFMNDRSKFINIHIIANLGFGVGFAFFPKYIAGFQVHIFVSNDSLLLLFFFLKK